MSVNTDAGSIPEEAWAEVQDAAERYEVLAEQGREVRFMTRGRRVRIELHEDDGSVVEPLSTLELYELFD